MSSKAAVRDSLVAEAHLLPNSGHTLLTVTNDHNDAAIDASKRNYHQSRPSLVSSPYTSSSPAYDGASLVDSDGNLNMSPNNARIDTPLVYLPRAGLSLANVTAANYPLQASVLTSDLDDPIGGSGTGGNPFDSSLSGATQSDTDKLFTVLANYLSLGQLELARTVMDQLFIASPEKLIRALRSIIFTHIPSTWLFSRAVPSAGHLSWLAYIEYKKLYSRVYPDSGAGAEAAAQDDAMQSRLGSVSSASSVAGRGMSLEGEIKNSGLPSTQPTNSIPRHLLPALSNTPINPYGFLTHDRLTLTLIEVEGCKLPSGTNAFHARVKLDNQLLQSKVVLASGSPLAASALAGSTSGGGGGGSMARAHASQSLQSSAGVTSFKHTFQTTVWYADSNLWIKVYACAPANQPATSSHINSSHASQHIGAIKNEICVGEVSLPLHQIRGKNKFHIWLPLHAPAHTNLALLHGASASANATTDGSSASAAAAAVAASANASGGLHSYGRVRLKLVWWKSGLVPAGDFSLKTRWLLETDLLMANAVINHRLAPGRKLLTPEIVEEMRNYVRVTWANQVRRQRKMLIGAQEKLMAKTVSIINSNASTSSGMGITAGLAGLFGKGSSSASSSPAATSTPTSNPNSTAILETSDRFPQNSPSEVSQDFSIATYNADVSLGDNTTSSGGTGDPLSTAGVHLSDDVFRHLRRLIRSVPVVGHSLCAQLCLISSNDDQPTHSDAIDNDQQLFQQLYTQLIGEMIVLKEFGRACEALVYACKDIFLYTAITAQSPPPNLSGADVGIEGAGVPLSPDQLPSPSLAMLDAIFLLFVVYIHHGPSATLERMARNLMENKIPGLELAEGSVGGGISEEKEGDAASGGSVTSSLGPAMSTPGPSQNLVVSSSENEKKLGSYEGSELDSASDEAANQTFALILDRKTKVYSALLAATGNMSMNMKNLVPGTMKHNLPGGSSSAASAASGGDTEVILKRFCLVEDNFLRALVDKMGRFPPFFEDLLGNPIDPSNEEHVAPTAAAAAVASATPQSSSQPAEVANVEAISSSDDPDLFSMLSAEQQLQRLLDEFLILDFADDPTFLHAFWRYYANYIRIQKEHVFEFPIQVSLACIRLNQWNKVNLVLKPFNKLRPLVVLLAWDSYENDYSKKRELIIRIWRTQRLHAAKEIRARRRQRYAVERLSMMDPLAPLPNALDSMRQALEEVDQELGDEDELDAEMDAEAAEGEGGASATSPSKDDADEFESSQASEPKLINWCDRLDVFVLWIDTLINIHPLLASLTPQLQEAQANSLLINLKQHSILYSFHTFLPSLAQPEQLLNLINPHESEELKHDYHIMRSFYAIRACLELMKRNESQTVRSSKNAISNVNPSANNEAIDEEAYAALFTQHLNEMKQHIFYMTQPHFQALTLEKIFSLLFINQKSWKRYQGNLQANLDNILQQNEGVEGGSFPQPSAESADADDEEDDLDADGYANEPHSGPEGAHKNRSSVPRGAYFHLKGELISSVLHFLKDTITELMSGLERVEGQNFPHNEPRDEDDQKYGNENGESPSNPSNALSSSLHLYPPSSILNRLNFLKSKVVEGIWRLSITKDLMKIKEPSLNHLVSSLSSMSVFFLQRDQSLEAHLNPPFSSMDYLTSIAQPFLRQHAAAARIVADTVKWNKLCMSVQEMDLAGKRKDIYSFILEYVQNYHDNCFPAIEFETLSVEDKFNRLKQHQHLQSYFLCMDSSLTFAHVLSELEYVSLIRVAIRHTRVCMDRLIAAEDLEQEKRKNELGYLAESVKKAFGNEEEETIDEEEEEESISLELLQFYTNYAETRCLIPSSHLLKSKRSECFHIFSLDDSNLSDGIVTSASPSASGPNANPLAMGASESMADELRPFGFESSPISTFTKWIQAHGAQTKVMKNQTESDSMESHTAYLQKYFEYLSSVSFVVPDEKAVLNPWVGLTGVKVIEYLALHTAHTRESSIPGMASIPHPAVSNFLDTTTNKHSHHFNNFAYLALQVLPALAAVRYVLRSSDNLTAGQSTSITQDAEAPAADAASSTSEDKLDDYQTICQLARQHSKFNSTFHRWIQWRLGLYQHLYDFTKHAQTIPFVFLSHAQPATAAGSASSSVPPSIHSVDQLLYFAKDAFSRESVVSDQTTIMILCEIYVDTFTSLDALWKKELKDDVAGKSSKPVSDTVDHQDHDHDRDDSKEEAKQPNQRSSAEEPYRKFLFQTKLSILDMCDQHLDHPSHHHCVNLIDRLLASIITDAACPHSLRPNLLLRVNHIVSASVWCLRYLQYWSDVNICTDVLLKCIAGLSTLEISDSTGVVPRKRGEKKPEYAFDHHHRFDEFESDEEEDATESQNEDDSADDVDADEEEIDAGVQGRGGRSGSLKPKKHLSSDDRSDPAMNRAKAAGHIETYTGPISELRSSIEFKYHIILIYKQLVEMDDGSVAKKEDTASDSNIPLSSVASPASVRDHLFPSWQTLEHACNTNLTSVIISLIQHKLVDIAQKLYVLYKTYSKLYPPPPKHKGLVPTAEEIAIEQHHKAQELLIDAHLTNQLESASLAALLSASSPTSDRIFAIKRLQSLPRHRLYDVGEGVLSYLDSSHSRYVIAQLLAQFLINNARELKSELGVSSLAAAAEPPSIHSTNPMTAVPGSLHLTNNRSEVASVMGGDSGSAQVVSTSMQGTMFNTLHTDALTSVDSSSVSHPPPRHRFYPSLSIEKERWFIQVHHATKLLVCLPEELQLKYAHLYSDPLAIVTELLKNGQHLYLRKIFPIFKEYCSLTSTPDDAYYFILNFASRLLTLGIEELNLDKEVGFMVLDLCAEYGEYQKVAKMGLIMCEVLSSKLIHHQHPYLLLHFITAILIYLGKNILYVGLHVNDPNHLLLFRTYEVYVRLCCGRKVDLKNPTYSAAVSISSVKVSTEGVSSSSSGVEGAAVSSMGEGKLSNASGKVYTDVESKLADESRAAEESLPLLYALISTPLVPALGSTVPLAQLPPQSALLSRMLGANFSLKDLDRPERAASVRDQLLNCEQKSLAKRIWKECEQRALTDFEPYVRARARQMHRG